MISHRIELRHGVSKCHERECSSPNLHKDMLDYLSRGVYKAKTETNLPESEDDKGLPTQQNLSDAVITHQKLDLQKPCLLTVAK